MVRVAGGVVGYSLTSWGGKGSRPVIGELDDIRKLTRCKADEELSSTGLDMVSPSVI